MSLLITYDRANKESLFIYWNENS